MLEELTKLGPFILSIGAAIIFTIMYYYFYKSRHNNDLEDEEAPNAMGRGLIRCFAISGIVCYALLWMMQNSTVSSLVDEYTNVTDVVAPTVVDTTLEIMSNNIMDRFNTGRPTF